MPGFTSISMYPKLWAGHRHPLQTTHRPPHHPRHRTPPRKATDHLHPRLTNKPAQQVLPASTRGKCRHRNHRQTRRLTRTQPPLRRSLHRAAPAPPRRPHPPASLLDRPHPSSRQRTRHQPHASSISPAEPPFKPPPPTRKPCPNKPNQHPAPHSTSPQAKNYHRLPQHQLPRPHPTPTPPPEQTPSAPETSTSPWPATSPHPNLISPPSPMAPKATSSSTSSSTPQEKSPTSK